MASDTLVEIKFRVDTTSWARQLGGFAKEVIPFAASYAVNGTVFAARDALRDEAKQVFDRPMPFSVQQAFGYNMARLNGDLKARIYIRDRQSAFYKYQILGRGGLRLPGDIGPGLNWLFVPVAPELVDPASGGIRRGTLRGLARRAAPKGQGKKVHRTTRARDAKRRPIFFASVFGTQAIWERPERTKAAGRAAGACGRCTTSRPPGSSWRPTSRRSTGAPSSTSRVSSGAYEDLLTRFEEAVRMRLGRILADRGLTGR